MTQVDRQFLSDRGGQILNLLVPMLTSFLMDREHLGGSKETLMSTTKYLGRGRKSDYGKEIIIYYDLWGVSCKIPKLIFNTYEILSCHPLS